jgi:ligand-binding SRPBCC domain-containing protein
MMLQSITDKLISQPLADLTRLLAADPKAPRARSVLRREVIVPASLDETFAFFSDASNLERLTPPWLNFAILSPMPFSMRLGAEIDYRVRLYGVAIPWRSRVDVWEPGVRFIDRQTVGPYRWWRHEHRFVAVPEGTIVIDHVEYSPRAGWFSSPFVRRELRRIFAYRHEAMREVFGSP